MSLHHAARNRTTLSLVHEDYDDEDDAVWIDIAEDGGQPFRRRFRARRHHSDLDYYHYYHDDDHNHGVGGDRRLAKFKKEYQLTAPRSRNRQRGFLFGVSNNETGPSNGTE